MDIYSTRHRNNSLPCRRLPAFTGNLFIYLLDTDSQQVHKGKERLRAISVIVCVCVRRKMYVEITNLAKLNFHLIKRGGEERIDMLEGRGKDELGNNPMQESGMEWIVTAGPSSSLGMSKNNGS